MSPDSEETDRAERFRAFAAEAGPHLTESESATWMDRLAQEHDGLRAAFSWFLDHGKGAKALQMAAAWAKGQKMSLDDATTYALGEG